MSFKNVFSNSQMCGFTFSPQLCFSKRFRAQYKICMAILYHHLSSVREITVHWTAVPQLDANRQRSTKLPLRGLVEPVYFKFV